MAKQQKQQPERKVYVTISSTTMRKPVRFECWRYWEIVGELIFRHADRQDAYDAARWCGRFAKSGDRRELLPDITMEVSEI